MVERAGAISFVPYRPCGPVVRAHRGGTDDSRRCDAARDEPCVDPFRAGPGAVPFPDYLRALNAKARLRCVATAPTPQPLLFRQTPKPAHTDLGWPRLGDISPVEPDPKQPSPLTRDVYLQPQGTGRLLDVLA